MVGLKISGLLTEILYAKENESGSIELRSLLLSRGSKTSDFQVVLNKARVWRRWQHSSPKYSLSTVTSRIIYVLFTGFCRGNASDTLDEKDCGAESEDDDGIPSSQPKGAIQQRTTKVGAEEGDSQVTIDVPEDEDDSIEDFDDD